MKNKQFFAPVAVALIISATGSAAAFFESVKCGITVLLCCLAVTAVFVIYTYKRYKEIQRLSDYLYKICNGLDALDIKDNTEGEFSILKNNISKTTLMLKNQAEMLKKDKIWLSDSLADISHQLKTPITSIVVMTDLLSQDNLSEEKRREFLVNIERQTERMQWLIVTLLKISKFDAGTITLKKEKVNLCDVADKALTPFLVQADIHNINIYKCYSEAFFEGDADWSIEAAENIIKNCIEHMPDGGELSVTVAENAVYSVLKIKDTGSGIEKEDLPHIFERFYKGKNSSADSVGIGLALSKSVFNRENAKVEVVSESGKGAEFVIKFYKNVL